MSASSMKSSSDRIRRSAPCAISSLRSAVFAALLVASQDRFVLEADHKQRGLLRDIVSHVASGRRGDVGHFPPHHAQPPGEHHRFPKQLPFWVTRPCRTVF